MVHANPFHNFCVALIVPSRRMLEKWAQEAGIQHQNFSELCNKADAVSEVEQSLSKVGLFCLLTGELFEILWLVKTFIHGSSYYCWIRSYFQAETWMNIAIPFDLVMMIWIIFACLRESYLKCFWLVKTAEHKRVNSLIVVELGSYFQDETWMNFSRASDFVTMLWIVCALISPGLLARCACLSYQDVPDINSWMEILIHCFIMWPLKSTWICVHLPTYLEWNVYSFLCQASAFALLIEEETESFL